MPFPQDMMKFTALLIIACSALSLADEISSSCSSADHEEMNEECHGSDEWYQRQINHWEKRVVVEGLSYDTMVGGPGHADKDIRDSAVFLAKHMSSMKDVNGGGFVALDVAAGLGRVTRELLLHHFAEVDLLEPSPTLMNEAKRLLNTSNTTTDIRGTEHPEGHRVLNFFQVSVHELLWRDLPHRYDVLWVQWAMDKMTDEHAIYMLKEARNSLRSSESLVIVKENICNVCDEGGWWPQGFAVDDEPTITRSLEYLQAKIFDAAGFKVIDQEIQKDFDPNLYPIYMLALRPV